jgi:hypothetical protein
MLTDHVGYEKHDTAGHKSAHSLIISMCLQISSFNPYCAFAAASFGIVDDM